MVFDPSVYECPSITTHIPDDIIISDESSDEDDDYLFDFCDRHYSRLVDIMEEDVFVNRLTMIDELEVVLATHGVKGILVRSSTPITSSATAITRSSAQWRLQHPHFSFRVLSEMMVLFALHGAGNILRSAPRRKTYLL